MTGEILVSDVELAKKWLSAGRLDAEIISALEHRGICRSLTSAFSKDCRRATSTAKLK